MDPYLRDAIALIVYENNHSDDETRFFDTFFKQDSIRREIEPYECLNTEQALKRTKQGTHQARERDDPDIAALTAEPGDEEGRVRPGARTTARNKKIQCDLMKRVLDSRRVFFHSKLIAVLDPETEALEEFAEVMASEDDSALRRILGLDTITPNASYKAPNMARLGPVYEDRTRQRMLKKYEHQLRHFRRIVHSRVDVYGNVQERVEYSGKKFDGPHGKKDDIVSSGNQLIYTMSLVAVLDYFSGTRAHIRMGK